MSEAAGGEVRQLISFRVGEEEYGLDLLRVKEVIRMRQVTWLPKAPSCVKGIINLRGDVIPIIDLRERFELRQHDSNGSTRVIVVEAAGQHVGMVVDSASQVVRVPSDQFDPPPLAVGEAARDFISEVGKMGDKLVIMIDADKMLDSRELSEIQESIGEATQEPVLRGA